VDREEAKRRHQQILAEGRLIAEQFKAAGEGRSDLVKEAHHFGGLYTFTFARRLEASLWAPQAGESEEDFQARSKKGLAADGQSLKEIEEARPPEYELIALTA
jgi:hypothetical protein